MRIATDSRLFITPLETAEALDIVSSILEREIVVIVEPAENHFEILRDIVARSHVRGATLMDAHLAVLALEHGATLYSSDRDFSRFSDLNWVNPLQN
jgi:toxin-antitoxin system PIN domain toxin